jgi:predicted metal-dependent peptidase
MLAYNPKWLDEMTQEQVNYAIIHEMLHLVNSHKHRSIGFEKKMAEKSADQLINTHIEENYLKNTGAFQVERPKEEVPLIPEKFKDNRTLEHLYNYNVSNEEQHGVAMTRSDGSGESDKEDDRDGQSDGSFDQHPDDEVPQEIREGMMNDFIQQQKSRGNVTSDIENFLKALEKPKTNYLNKVKSALSQMMGKLKKQTWNRFTRKDPDENMLKGHKKYQKTLNVVLDTSGSVGGDFEKLLGYIFYNGIEINLIQCDTEVKEDISVKSKQQVQKLKIKGLGGTIISPAFRVVEKKYNDNPTIVLTDGCTDVLNLNGIKHEVMIISTEQEAPIGEHSCRVRQFVIGPNN